MWVYSQARQLMHESVSGSAEYMAKNRHSCNKGQAATTSKGLSLNTALRQNGNKPQQGFSQLFLTQLLSQQLVPRPHSCATSALTLSPGCQTCRGEWVQRPNKHLGSDTETSAAFIYLSSAATS